MQVNARGLDALGIVVEDPAGVLRPARLVDQATDLVVLALPESAYPAMIPILVPELRVDMTDRVERRDELVAMTNGARGKLLRARQIEANAFKRMWERHGRTSDRCRDQTASWITLDQRNVRTLMSIKAARAAAHDRR
jgi:hypothetical protein